MKRPAPPPDAIALLEATLEASQDGILVVDLNRNVIRWNNQYLKMFGLTPEVVRRGVDAIVEAIVPQLENGDYVRETSPSIWSEPELEISDILRFTDGRVYHRLVAPHRLRSVVVGRVASFRDVSQSVRTEEALEQHRALLEKAQEMAHVGSWIAELDGSDRVRWSAELRRIFGASDADFAGTSSILRESVHPLDRASVKAAFTDAVKGKRPFDIEHRIVRSDGSVRWIHGKADVVRDASGRALQMVGIIQDITDRRQLEDQLRQSQKMEAIGRLAGGIAHDLNNALTAIGGYAELALGQLGASHPAHDDVNEIRRAAERAGSVTRQLLAFSRKELVEPRLFDLNAIITDLGRMLSRLLSAGIEVRTELAPSIPAILGDPGQVEQAVINLAVNARDAMPDGGRLVLSTSVEEVGEAEARANAPMTPGHYIVLRVSDSGHGMSRETQARIFEPFFTTKDVGKGTGLGLSMVYGTLKQIGGFIFVDSELGHGTTFRLYFRSAAPALDAAAASSSGTADDVADLGATVLVVEDEPAVRNLVASSLRTEGYRLLVAASAEEALKAADAHPDRIDLLLTDAIMPGKSGIELANLLVVQRPGLQVMIMSGYTEETLSGFDERVALLRKPFVPKELRRRVREALDQARDGSK